MPSSAWLLALLSLFAADALRGGGGARTGASRVALKSGAQSQRMQPATPRSVVVLHAVGPDSGAVLPLASPAPHTSRVGLGGAANPSQQVSNLGRVRTADGIITEGSARTEGYLTASINGKSHRVHRLVAQAGFVPPPPSEKHTQVNHKDRDLTNNRADNLEWVTRSENIQRSYDTNAERKSNAPYFGPSPGRSKAVLGRKHGSEEEWVEYASGNDAARKLGVDPSSISRCCRGERKRAGEYEFKWAPLAEDQHDKPGEIWRDVV